jgi:hypothetical protein
VTNADPPPGTILLADGSCPPWTPEAMLFTDIVRSTEKAAELGGRYEA